METIVSTHYKKTKIGLIPTEWQVDNLSKIIKPVVREVDKPSEPYWRLGIRSHGKGTFHEFVENPNDISMDKLYIVQENDLIVNITFAWEHAIALANSDDENKLVSHRFPTYQFINDNSPIFYKYYVLQPRFKYELLNISPGGAGRNRVMNKTDFLKLEVPIPPKKEQEKIAEILTTWDVAISKQAEYIASKELQKKALLQKLFSGEIRFDGYSGTWETMKLKNILFEHGTKSDGKCEVHSVSVSKGLVNQIEHLGRSYAAENTSNYNLVKPFDLVYTKSPTGNFPFGIIKQNLNSYNAIVSPLYGVFSPKNRYIGNLVHLYFESPQRTINYLNPIIQKGAKNTINITNKTFLSKQVVLPTDEKEQMKISNLFQFIDDEIVQLKIYLEELKKQKKGLMQKLLTGQVRVRG